MEGGRVCLVMPFRNEAESLPAVLASVAAQRFDAERLMLIAVDDGSTDGSAALVERWLRSTSRDGRVVQARAGGIAAALNRGLASAPDDAIIVRIDAHTLYEPDYVATIVEAFRSLPDDVWCIGGASLPADGSTFGKRLHAALLSNVMGLGPADYRREAIRPVASVYLGAWRPGVLTALGGYDESWKANEDAELAARVREAGGRVVRVPAHSRKIVTRGARAALVQWTRYGYWRARTVVRHPATLRVRHVAPSAAVAVTASLLIAHAFVPLSALYLAFAVATVAARPRGERAEITAASLVYFPLVHAGFGCAFLLGVLMGLVSPPRRSTSRPARAL
jgi:succinoglycan biosynthesis protein ExoA